MCFLGNGENRSANGGFLHPTQVDILCTELAVGKPLTMKVHPKDGSAAFDVELSHTYNEAQIEWFKNGSALNTMAKNAK